jgi:centrosomal protein CEP57
VYPCGLCDLQKPVPVTEAQYPSKPFRTTSQARANPQSSGEPVSICDSLSELLMTMEEELDQMNM